MGYLANYRGDYGGRRPRGDLFGFLGKVGGSILSTVGTALSGGSKPAPPTFPGMPVVRSPGVGGMIARAVPGGKTGFEVRPDGTVRKKYRRMNYGNTKALKRALRREKGFVDLAKRTLKGSGYKVVRSGYGKRKSS